jgi:indole-3-glycerol phosphate synthase
MAPQSPVDAVSASIPLEEIKRLALALPAPRASLDTLRDGRLAVIAELDPTRPDRLDLAEQYERGGVGAIAVPAGISQDSSTMSSPSSSSPSQLQHVQHLEHLAEVAAHTDAPLLSLEPATSGYQLWQARAHGADLVLIAAADLLDDALVCLVERAGSIGMAAMVEVRDGRSLVRALRTGARVILLRPPADATEAEARSALEDLLPMVPEHIVRVAECGPSGRADLIACARLGADAVLIGRSLLSGEDPGATVSSLASMGAHPALSRRR